LRTFLRSECCEYFIKRKRTPLDEIISVISYIFKYRRHRGLKLSDMLPLNANYRHDTSFHYEYFTVLNFFTVFYYTLPLESLSFVYLKLIWGIEGFLRKKILPKNTGAQRSSTAEIKWCEWKRSWDILDNNLVCECNRLALESVFINSSSSHFESQVVFLHLQGNQNRYWIH
jgi:hypothetical protein